MIRGLPRRAARCVLALCAAAALLPPPGPARGAEAGKAAQSVVIGYVELADDPRYAVERTRPAPEADRPPAEAARPYAGAAMAIEEAAVMAPVIGVAFSLRRSSGADGAALARSVGQWAADGVHFVVADLPAPALLALADQVKDKPILLLNATAPEDDLRGRDCRRNVAHTIPSEAMRADALVQYLVSKRWRNILVLQGPTPQDGAAGRALARSAAKFGARIVKSVPFRLTNDPRQREQSNVALMTAGASYDVVDVIDARGEFARYVPYATQAPRPVVGATGLVARGWHWSWDQHGAIQLNKRFEAAAARPMRSIDWAAWAAVKAVEQAVLRARTTDYARLRAYLLGPDMKLDGYKGNPMSFRPWDQQLRQPILLATGNAVIARAPLSGFLHQSNELDTLGADRPETACAF